MENYFILLELPFDPPEENEQIITQTIARKQAQWSKEMVNPVKKAKVSEYIAHISDMRNVMLDPKLRAEAAAEARQVKIGKKKELEERLTLYHAKGDELSPQDLKLLVRTFGPYGFGEEEILSAFVKGAKKPGGSVDLDDCLEKMHADNIRIYLQQLDQKGETLYGFLGLKSDASCGELRAAAEAMGRKILMKGEKTGRDGAIQSLCGLCGILFRDEAGKRKYDNYVRLTRYTDLNDAIDALAKGNDRRLEPKMKEGLIDKAVSQYHVSVSEGSSYIDDYCAYMGYALAENKVLCGLCGTENPPGAVNCANCGKPLFISCPSCNTRNNNSAKSCAKCGFDLSQMERAAQLLRQARQKHAEKSYEEAERLLKEAQAYWPGHPDIRSLEETIAKERNRALETLAEVMEDIQEKRFYGARTKIAQARAQGFPVDEDLSKKVEWRLEEVEQRLSLMRQRSGDEAFRIAMELSELVTDCQELNQSLAKYPPQDCPELTGSLTGDGVALSWLPSPSAGDISYQLVRRENAYPNNQSDGEVLYVGKELFYTDSRPGRNRLYYYAVYALRVGVYSKAARLAEPVVFVEEIRSARAVGGDGSVTLSWEKPSGAVQIRLEKCRGNLRPQEDGDYEPVPCPRTDGAVVSGLVNGEGYWFAVSAGIAINGKVYYSEKVYLQAVPQRPAKPLRDFTVEPFGGGFRCAWMQSEWEVMLLRADRKPEYSVGEVYDLEELLEKYEKIDLQKKNATEGSFQLDLIGECYVIPAVANGSNVIMNRAAYLSCVPAVTDVSFEGSASGKELYVNFVWPESVERSLVIYRTDTWPVGIDDPYACKIECSRRQYDLNQGVLIRNPEEGTYFALIYTYLDKGERRLYSEGVRARFDNQRQRDVLYTFEYKKPGLFHKKTALLLTVETGSGACELPPFVVVAKHRGIPLKRGDGEVICVVSQATQIKGNLTFEFNIQALQPGTRLKLFFSDDESYKWFKPACKAGNTI